MIGRQLLEGLQVLHGNHLAHRDLTPTNIFVARCAPDWWIKLGDFGIVRQICAEQVSKLSRIGTCDYMAPEILLESDDDEDNWSYTPAVDVWSLGCVLFRLLTQQLPFPQARHLRLYWQSKSLFPTDVLIKHNVSKDGVSLLSDMMKSNPADWMNVTLTLLHSWVFIQESTSTPEYLDSFEESAEDELDDKLANKGSATEGRTFIPVDVHKSNLEVDQPFYMQLLQLIPGTTIYRMKIKSLCRTVAILQAHRMKRWCNCVNQCSTQRSVYLIRVRKIPILLNLGLNSPTPISGSACIMRQCSCFTRRLRRVDTLQVTSILKL